MYVTYKKCVVSRLETRAADPRSNVLLLLVQLVTYSHSTHFRPSKYTVRYATGESLGQGYITSEGTSVEMRSLSADVVMSRRCCSVKRL
jgi:hypothetical protein